ncbi:uncharacterized protein [Polyergus mexicanus]|uniref:uncharacterized protein n=1 Tax=Polyergus mexicanus TaxID=615972 RepID=UPI0038B43E6E
MGNYTYGEISLFVNIMRKNMNTRINGTNVILVPYQEKHVVKYHEWMKNPTLQYLTGSEPLTLQEEFEMQKRWLEDEDKCTFIILDKCVFLSTGSEIDAMIGDTNLFFNDSQESNIAEIEIMIADEAHRGRKRGWESVILMLHYGFETLNINQFRAKIKSNNVMSINMFEKLGFQELPIAEESKNSADIKGPTLRQIQRFCETLKLVDEDTSMQSTNYNWPQLKRYAIYGCFLAGPILYRWYKWLDTFYSGTSVRTVLMKLFADQFIFTPPLLMIFFISMSLMEAKLDIFQECKLKFLRTFQTSCGYWLPVQLVNFMLVPPSLRVTYVSIASFCWINILCYLKNVPIIEYEQRK